MMVSHSTKRNRGGGSRGSRKKKPEKNPQLAKIEKHLDLTKYLSFLRNIFGLSISGSIGDDAVIGKKGKNAPSVPTSNKNNSPKTKSPKKDPVKEEEKPKRQRQPRKCAPNTKGSELLSSSSSPFKNNVSAQSTSTSSSNFHPFLSADHSPMMTDIEFNNLLKRTNYLGGEIDVGGLNLEEENDNSNDSDKKKKKKKKPKKKHEDKNPRQNRPNSGGRGNGPSSNNGNGSSSSEPSNSSSSNNTSSENGSSSKGSSSNNNNVGGGGCGSGSHVGNSNVASLQCFSNNNNTVSKPCVNVNINNYRPNATLTNCDNSAKKLEFLGKGLNACFENTSASVVMNGCPSELFPLQCHEEFDDSLSACMSLAAKANDEDTIMSSQRISTQGSRSEDGLSKFGDSLSNESSSTGSWDIEEDDEDDEDTSGKEKPSGKRKRDKEKDSSRKKLMLQQHAQYIELMNFKRKKIYTFISKKEVPKSQRTNASIHRDSLATKRRLALACSRAVRQKAIQSQKIMKESAWRAKRLTREMQQFWKQTERIEKEIRRQKEKQEEEQRKQDEELTEAKRGQRNLNFVITQIELYSHFLEKRLKNQDLDPETVEEDDARVQGEILESLNEDSSDKFDFCDIATLRAKAKTNVRTVLQSHMNHTKYFEADALNGTEPILPEESDDKDGTHQNIQPRVFSGDLKQYQLKGLEWLINLFNQGVNGILADEPGLGKTVQSIAVLSHIADKGTWGPFLIISPVTSLHSWEQEIKKFVPDFKVVPYWGNPQERKILRQFWQQNNLHTQRATFHVVVTSYSVVVQDLKYLNKINWQYLILDEAETIKPTSSLNHWKVLPGISCRNRLLLTGNRIPNAIFDIWSLLRFLFPTFFDSQDVNNWLPKDFESHTDNNTLEKDNWPRLQKILKPFMLRRLKKDVQGELNDKVEIFVPCTLATRQKNFHAALIRKIITEDLMKSTISLSHTSTYNLNLMNMVLQFRKICNHPDLIERRDVKCPFYMRKMDYVLPNLIHIDKILNCQILQNAFNIYHPSNVHNSILKRGYNCKRVKSGVSIDDLSCEWSFSKFCDLSPSDIFKLFCGGVAERLQHLVKLQIKSKIISHERLWSEDIDILPIRHIILINSPNLVTENTSTILGNIVFTSHTDSFYTWRRNIVEPQSNSVINGTQTDLEPLYMPKFLYKPNSKVVSEGFELNNFKSDSNREIPEEEYNLIMFGRAEGKPKIFFTSSLCTGLMGFDMHHGWSGLAMPGKEKLVADSGKMFILDKLLKQLKEEGRRVVICSMMPAMTDLIEDFLIERKLVYIRLDGPSRTSSKRDLAADLQTGSDVFVFLLSTRSTFSWGNNFPVADSIIFYDSDMNPAVDQKAMDKVIRLGQPNQVTVYRLFVKGTIEERILQRVKLQNDVLKPIDSDELLKPDVYLKSKDLLSLLLDDDDLMERKVRYRQAEKKFAEKNEKKAVGQNTEESSFKISCTTTNGRTNGVGIQDDLSPSSSPDDSDEMDYDVKCIESFDMAEYNDIFNSSAANAFYDEYSRAIDWNGSMSEYEEDLPFIPKKPKLGRGTGRRGRPPSRVRVQIRDFSGDPSSRRGPGRPRLKPIGPLNQGIRGRKPGRPPLSKKSETISSTPIPSSEPYSEPSQHVFEIYHAQDVNRS